MRGANDVLETYDAKGRLVRLSNRSGFGQSLSYQELPGDPEGRLSSVIDDSGRSLTFRYSSQGRLVEVTTPAGTIKYFYEDDTSASLRPLLVRVEYPDGSVRSYHYERTDLPFHLTGRTDELGRRIATYRYDDPSGRATQTESANGLSRYIVDYASQYAQSVVTDPLGTQRTRNFAIVRGVLVQTSVAQPAGSGSSACSDAQSYDANGNVASRDDFNGNRICYASDLTRNLETVRVEGLANTASCAALTATNAVLPALSRKHSTQWHPDWRLATKLDEPKRRVTRIYNGQPDPLNANAIASCAPSTALLPDGKPIAVLCKQVEEATTDADGSKGFSAALQSGVAKRISQWSYNQRGQILTPRTR